MGHGGGARPALRIHYVKLDMGSAYFIWRPFGHVEKLYMGDTFGSSDDTPGLLGDELRSLPGRASMSIASSIIHPIGPTTWRSGRTSISSSPRRWRPMPVQEAAAERHGELLRRAGRLGALAQQGSGPD